MADTTQHMDVHERPDSGDTQPGTVGERLKQQRKARGISLVEVSEHTKIGKKYLEALEEGHYEAMPCETYIRGFLKAYAKYLELDDEQVLRAYREGRQQSPSAERGEPDTAEDERANNQPVWIPLLALLVLAGVGAGFFLLWPAGEQPDDADLPAVTESTEPDLALEPAARVPGPNDELSLRIRAKEKTWVTLMIDGRQEPDVTLNAGEDRTWNAKDRFVLWTGNAGGIEVYFNGEMQPMLGKPGEVRKEVVFARPAAEPPAAP